MWTRYIMVYTDIPNGDHNDVFFIDYQIGSPCGASSAFCGEIPSTRKCFIPAWMR